VKIIFKNKLEQIFLKKGTNNTHLGKKEIYHRARKLKVFINLKNKKKNEHENEKSSNKM
jgi:hypothetical protein